MKNILEGWPQANLWLMDSIYEQEVAMWDEILKL